MNDTRTPIIERPTLRRFLKSESRVWGANVKNRRKALDLTLADLAGLIDSTPQTIHKVERGEIVPRDDLRLAIAIALAQEVTALFPMPDRRTILRETGAA